MVLVCIFLKGWIINIIFSLFINFKKIHEGPLPFKDLFQFREDIKNLIIGRVVFEAFDESLGQLLADRERAAVSTSHIDSSILDASRFRPVFNPITKVILAKCLILRVLSFDVLLLLHRPQIVSLRFVLQIYVSWSFYQFLRHTKTTIIIIIIFGNELTITGSGDLVLSA